MIHSHSRSFTPASLALHPRFSSRVYLSSTRIALLLILALPLVPHKLEAQSNSGTDPVPITVPTPAAPAPILPPPPLSPVGQPLSRPDVAEIQRLTPRVAIWRPNAQRGQVPARSRREHLEQALVTGTEPVTVRLQFLPQAVGERVTVIAGGGLSLDPPEQVLTISTRGECLVTVQLFEGAPRGHLLVYCKMIKTVVPLTRAPRAAVEAEEARTGGRP